ncbi:MAG: outer membrane beta-barrel protein [bacterium]|nr:outer membrane beta-barrel protein [bacterium]
MKISRIINKTAVVGVVAGLALTFSSKVMAEEVNGLKISGFVDTSLYESQYGDSSFGLDQVEIDIEKKIDGSLSLRADINYMTAMKDYSTAAGPEVEIQQFDDLVEQAYVTYNTKGIDLTFGKFNAPIGFELLDPVDMYQYSHALVFDYGLPTNLTGAMGSYEFNDMADISLYVVNGWDNNYDNNNSRTVGGRLGLTPFKGLNIGLSTISGKEGPTDDKLTVVDMDLTLKMVDKLTIGAEYNSGKDEGGAAAGEDAEWSGFMVMANYAATNDLSLTLRYDSFDDEDGTRFNSGMIEKRTAYTVAALYSLGEGAGFLLEYRTDESDEKVFDSGAEDSEASYAAEFTFSF